MRKALGITFAAAWCCTSSVRATELAMTLEAELCNSSTIVVGPECEVVYRVIGELTDDSSQGLAAIVFDLEFDGGSLPQADEPTGLPMLNFTTPLGFSRNSAGFGGTPRDGNLIQVGGAQNVFNHGQWLCQDDDGCPGPSLCTSSVCTPIVGLPVGALITDVAAPGSPVVLTTGSLTAPDTEGVYSLQITSIKANVVRHSATGDPVWVTESAGPGPVTNLTITVTNDGLCCGETREACCLPGGGCVSADANECADVLNGTPLGPDSACEGDYDGDGTDGHCGDECPTDPGKTAPEICGCGVSDTDGDGDTVPDCLDVCENQDDRIDLNHNGVPDCLEEAPIPAVSQWGRLILTLSLVVAGKVSFSRRRTTVGIDLQT
ncbi:MAG: hypothetical protein PVI86_01605 [Phycisphaerae bacterium]|jgi:hypothetical protein